MKLNDYVKAPHPRGGAIIGRIIDIDDQSDLAEAYGTQARLDSGYEVCLSQCTELTTEEQLEYRHDSLPVDRQPEYEWNEYLAAKKAREGFKDDAGRYAESFDEMIADSGGYTAPSGIHYRYAEQLKQHDECMYSELLSNYADGLLNDERQQLDDALSDAMTDWEYAIEQAEEEAA